MNIKFIGTGTMGSTTRANTSILVDNILLDCGMGTVKQLERLGKQIKDLDYIAITHFHPDHFFDIPNALHGRKIRKENNKVLNIIVPVGGRNTIVKLMDLAFEDMGSNENIEENFNVKFIELSANETYSFEDYKIATIELKHGNCNPVYGYLLTKGNATIGYTGDTYICDNFFRMCEQANCMFADATTLVSAKKEVHISFEELKEFAEKYSNCKFYAVHRSDYEIQDKGKVNVPSDGEEIKL